MPNPRFLLDNILLTPGEYVIGRQESHHAIGVLRLRPGDAVIVFDGAGHRAEAEILDASREGVVVRVDEVETEPHMPLRLTIATAIPKGKRWQILVEKYTELGVDAIVPVLSTRSVVKGEGDIGKWRRWIIEAAKQSRRAHLPEIFEPAKLPDVVATAKRDNAILLMADARGENPFAFRDLLDRTTAAVVLVGPEGGFTQEEYDECRRHGARGICLSPFTLRIETAAATVCAIIREMLM